MIEQWSESYIIATEDLANTLYTTHGMTFKIYRTACDTVECWIDWIAINGIDRDKIYLGKSIVVDGVTFHLKSSPRASHGMPMTLVVSGGAAPGSKTPWVLLGAALIGLYLLLKR